MYATATGVESGRNVGVAGGAGSLEEGNNNNLAWRGSLCHSGGESERLNQCCDLKKNSIML